MWDFTAIWVTLQQRKHLLAQLTAAILLFGAGWQLGRVMSPYYAAHPIVFTESASENQPLASAPADLAVLREQGTEQAAASTPPSPAVAAAATVVPAAVVSTSPGAQLFVGSVNSDKYHHKDCASGRQIKIANQVWFASQAEAEAAGYVPSQCTKEKLGI